MSKSLISAFAVLALLVLPASVGASGFPQCDGCHGPAGNSKNVGTPSLAGMSAYYLEAEAAAYAKGHRPCVSSPFPDAKAVVIDKCAIMSPLSAAETRKMAAYYSRQPFKPTPQPADEALAKRGKAVHELYCEKCHTAGGSDPADDAGLLQGQRLGYLRQTIADMRTGRRKATAAMVVKLEKLELAEIEALLNFYATTAGR